MRIAIVGCGFVADFYVGTLGAHPELELTGVMDSDAQRAVRFGAFYGLHVYRTLEELLGDARVEIVLNLTNPHSHYEVSRACIEAGKNVYSEKPLATEFARAEELVRLAEARGLRIASAPCGVLGESAQTIWKALDEQLVGPVRLVYAELDDGLTHRLRYRHWKSKSGTPWPWKDEFEVGCTLEHAGYYLTWLVAFFGPALRLTSFASCRVPDKQTDVPLDVLAPDFSVACIEFASGVVARLTCSIVAPLDRGLRIIGDNGVLLLRECWDYRSPVRLKSRTKLSLWAEKYRWLSAMPGLAPRKVALLPPPPDGNGYRKAHRMDFARGVSELAAAIIGDRPCRLSAEFCLHVNEIVLAIQDQSATLAPRTLTTTCRPMEPLLWTKKLP